MALTCARTLVYISIKILIFKFVPVYQGLQVFYYYYFCVCVCVHFSPIRTRARHGPPERNVTKNRRFRPPSPPPPSPPQCLSHDAARAVRRARVRRLMTWPRAPRSIKRRPPTTTTTLLLRRRFTAHQSFLINYVVGRPYTIRRRLAAPSRVCFCTFQWTLCLHAYSARILSMYTY